MNRAKTVASRPGRRRAGTIALWTPQIAAAAMLINAAIAKFAGSVIQKLIDGRVCDVR